MSAALYYGDDNVKETSTTDGLWNGMTENKTELLV